MIITDKQLRHISERHPEAYDNVVNYVNAVIQDPDYIIRDDKHEKSGLVVKRMPVKDDHLILVLRICTADDPAEHKNSVITSWDVSEKRLKNYLRNKKILYTRE